MEAPEMPLPIAQPRAGTRAGIALGFIDKWMTVKAEGLYSSVDRRFPMPACAYMDRECRWRLAHLYNERLLAWGDLTLDSLCERVRPLEAWLHWVASGFMLLQYLQSIVPEVDRVYAELLEERRHAREAKAAVKQQAASNQQVPQPAPITASECTAIVHRRDDALATQVARREAWKAARVTGNLSMPPPGFSAISQPATPSGLRHDDDPQTGVQGDSVDLIPDSQAQDVIAETQLTSSGSSQVSPAPIIPLIDAQNSPLSTISSMEKQPANRGSSTAEQERSSAVSRSHGPPFYSYLPQPRRRGPYGVE